jgi:hypothetical protein
LRELALYKVMADDEAQHALCGADALLPPRRRLRTLRKEVGPSLRLGPDFARQQLRREVSEASQSFVDGAEVTHSRRTNVRVLVDQMPSEVHLKVLQRDVGDKPLQLLEVLGRRHIDLALRQVRVARKALQPGGCGVAAVNLTVAAQGQLAVEKDTCNASK